MRAILCAVAFSALMLSGHRVHASEEEFLPWNSVRVECEHDQIGRVVVKAVASNSEFKSLDVAAFGRNYQLPKAELAKLDGFPLSSLSTTYSLGFERPEDRTVMCRFSRVFYNDVRELVQERAIVMVVKDNPDITIVKQREVLNQQLQRGSPR